MIVWRFTGPAPLGRRREARPATRGRSSSSCLPRTSPSRPSGIWSPHTGRDQRAGHGADGDEPRRHALPRHRQAAARRHARLLGNPWRGRAEPALRLPRGRGVPRPGRQRPASAGGGSTRSRPWRSPASPSRRASRPGAARAAAPETPSAGDASGQRTITTCAALRATDSPVPASVSRASVPALLRAAFSSSFTTSSSGASTSSCSPVASRILVVPMGPREDSRGGG